MSVYDDRVLDANFHMEEARSPNESLASKQNQILKAQVHAMLALAEQQRIANVIAIAQFHTVEDSRGNRLVTGSAAASLWRGDALQALGLNDGRVK